MIAPHSAATAQRPKRADGVCPARKTPTIFHESAAMIDTNDQKQWGEPELDKAQAENDAIFAEIDGLKGLVEDREITIEQAQARFIELLERHRLVGERCLQ
jgi:hypothetical protein